MKISSQCFVCVFAVLTKVSLQVTVEGVIGKSVVLPCSSIAHDLEPQDINVHWRHNDSMIVCDIIMGKDKEEEQDPQYKNRVESFPEDYLKGNFSIKLKNLQHTDAGDFSCLITYEFDQKTVQLIIKEPPKEINVETSTSYIICIVTVAVTVIAIIAAVIALKEKLNLRSCWKTQAAEFVPVST